VFRGKETERKNPIFWEWSDGQAAYFNSWKIVKEGRENSWDLYNLENDPTETNNLAEKYPGKVEELEYLFEEWKEGLPEF